MSDRLSRAHLAPAHLRAAQNRFDDVVVLHDHSWGDTDTKVLEVQADGQHCIVKTFGPNNHHFEREVQAHREFLTPLTAVGRAPVALHIDDHARLIVTGFLPGDLVEGSQSEWEPQTYRQAGELLAQMHDQAARADPDFMQRSVRRTRLWLQQPHQIAPETEQRLREILDSIQPAPVTVVPTHGDWQPRNWIIHRGRVSVIDFGRAAWRCPEADFTRMSAQQFRRRPDLAHAFAAGYGRDPRVGELWRKWQLFEAIGTAVYAYGIGAADFEAQGHRMITDALADYQM